MITTDDERWLAATYPGLVPSDGGVIGTIQFTATYNADLNRFLILGDGVVDDVGGIKLSCSYRIRIEERKIRDYSALPAVYVEGVDPIDKRHFSQNDKSACLCSPVAEMEFLDPSFNFRAFLEQLVIPFLYGQSFYSQYECWPWNEYAHGTTGLLESFLDSDVSTGEDLKRFLDTLAHDRAAWPKVRAALQRDVVKGHTECFCPKRDHMRRCHPRALAGLRRLHQSVKHASITLPAVQAAEPRRVARPSCRLE